VVAATNIDLMAAVATGTFREDLFYRLNVFPIQIPSLRERVDDIPLLVEYLIERYAKKTGKKIKTITKKSLDLFQAYEWPGNIRELQNVVERAVILSDGERFSVDEKWLKHESSQESRRGSIPDGALSRDRKRERAFIETALADSEGRVSVRPGPRTGWEFRDKRSSRRFVAWASTSTGFGTRNFRLLESQLFRSTCRRLAVRAIDPLISVYKKYRPSHFSRDATACSLAFNLPKISRCRTSAVRSDQPRVMDPIS